MKANQTLNDFRKNSGISQEKLAELVGVSRQTVSRWEQGAFTPSAENLAKLSEVFDVPVDAFLKDDWALSKEAEPEIQFVEVPVPMEASVPRPGNFRLLALLAMLVLIISILLGVLLFRERHAEVVSQAQMESEAINDVILNEPVELLPPWETES